MSTLLLKLAPLIREPAFLLLLLSSAGIGLLQLFDGKSGRRKGDQARFASNTAIQNARHQVLEQLCNPKIDSTALTIGRPHNGEDKRFFPVPDAQQSVMVHGAPGVGKTVSVLQPLILSALSQGHSMVLFDAKYDNLTARLIPIALEMGYEVHYFVPGYPESGILNPLDFIQSPEDLTSAREIAKGLHANAMQSGRNGRNDPFFDEAAVTALSAGMAMAKATEYPDLLTTHAFLSLPDLPERLSRAQNLNPWLKAAFSQLISLKDSERTIGSILGTAIGVLNNIMVPEVADVFCGHSTIPLRLEGRQLLVLGLDRRRRKTMAPLLGAVMQIIVQENTAFKRKHPLCLAFDELPLLMLPDLSQWLNLHREDGLIWLLGQQHKAQSEAVYGKEHTESIVAACSTKFWFNPQHPRTAKELSQQLGQHEYRSYQHTRGWNSGRYGSTSRSRAEHWQWRPLVPEHVILGFRRGECLVQNPHFADDSRGYLPFRHRFKLDKRIQRTFKRAERRWQQHIQPALIHQYRRPPLDAKDIAARQTLAEALLPQVAQALPEDFG
ncbi:MAG: type IV secretion system DNA-binding domain-containing protein [Cyanobacteria bacterium P01_F01_bin.53]